MKTVIEMAREAKLPEAWISDTGVLKWSDLERFAELVRAEEREACAKVADYVAGRCLHPDEIAETIRARGSNT